MYDAVNARLDGELPEHKNVRMYRCRLQRFQMRVKRYYNDFLEKIKKAGLRTKTCPMIDHVTI
jgi:hypothetical protein